jgi:hypothetical protein
VIRPGRRPKRKGDRFDLMRAAEVGDVPPLYKPRRGSKFADPEDILQGQVNEALGRAGQFHFRLSAHVLDRANDSSVKGWPDNPMITKLQPGLALLGPLELKKEGRTLSAGQVEMQKHLGTVEADSWEKAWAYVLWFRASVDHVKRLLLANPLPALPAEGPMSEANRNNPPVTRELPTQGTQKGDL